MPPIAPPPAGAMPLAVLLDDAAREQLLTELLDQTIQQGDRIDVLVAAVQDLGDEVNRLLHVRERTLRVASSYRQQIAEMRAAALDGAPE